MITIGIDPDLHDLAMGVWEDGKPRNVFVAHVPKKKGVIQHEAVLEMVKTLDGFGWLSESLKVSAIAVEAQTLQRTGLKQHKRPQDIVILGNVAGAALMGFSLLFSEARMFFPPPEVWKGQIPKDVMQARLYHDLEWGFEQTNGYAVPRRPPPTFNHITKGQWKHVGDALLLARWAAQQIALPKPGPRVSLFGQPRVRQTKE